MRVILGNIAARDRGAKGKVECIVRFPEGRTVPEAFVEITDARGVWANQSTKAPAWVFSDNKTLEALLAEHYDCPRGRKAGFKKEEEATA